MAKRKGTAAGETNLAYINEALRPLAVAMDSIKPDPNNAAVHDAANMAVINASLRRFGQTKPLVVRKQTMHIAAGNGTYAAAKELGWTHIAANITPLTAAEARDYAIADNRASDLHKYNAEIMLSQVTAIKNSTPELITEFALEEFLLDPSKQKTAEIPIPTVFGINIDCGSEAVQRTLYEELKRRGYEVKLVTM